MGPQLAYRSPAPAQRPAQAPAPKPAAAHRKRAGLIPNATLNEFYVSGYYKGALSNPTAQFVDSGGYLLFGTLDATPTNNRVTTVPADAKTTFVSNLPLQGTDKDKLIRDIEFGGVSIAIDTNLTTLTQEHLAQWRAQGYLEVCVNQAAIPNMDRIMLSQIPNPFALSGPTTLPFADRSEIGTRDFKRSFLPLRNQVKIGWQSPFTILMGGIPSAVVTVLNTSLSGVTGAYFGINLHLHQAGAVRANANTIGG